MLHGKVQTTKLLNCLFTCLDIITRVILKYSLLNIYMYTTTDPFLTRLSFLGNHFSWETPRLRNLITFMLYVRSYYFSNSISSKWRVINVWYIDDELLHLQTFLVSTSSRSVFPKLAIAIPRWDHWKFSRCRGTLH